MFDVGCNCGSNSEYYVNNDYQVFAFEPTPYLCNILTSKFCNKPNFILIQKAISNIEGKMKFNIAGQSDWGCSSLLNFISDTTLYWKDRYDFKVTDVIDVDVIRLDSFIKMLDIKSIDYFHCDIQGLDLSALQSLGEYINIIKEGQVEVSNIKNVLYNSSNNYVDDVIQFLEKNDFKIQSVSPNDMHNNESNLKFISKKYSL